MTSHRHLRKVTLIVLVAAITGTWLIAQTANPHSSPDPVELVKQGRKLNGEGKQDEAIALYRQALGTKPDLYDAHLAMGMALDLKGDYAQARRHLDQAIAVAPAASKAQALRAMAVSYAFEGNAAAAAKYEQQVFDTRLAASDFIGAAEIANELARVYLESGDAKNARKWYETGHQTALRKADLKPTEKDLWDFRWEHAQARIAARQGKRDAAQKHVAAAKALLDKGTNPEQAPYLPYLAGYVAFYSKDFRTAAGEFAKANQEDPFILVMLAQAHEHLGDSVKAMDLYRQVLASNSHGPTNAFARPLATKKMSGKTR